MRRLRRWPGAVVALWLAALAVLGASRTAVLGSGLGGGRAKACSAPGRWSGGGSMSSGISMAVVAVDRVDGLDRRPCCSPALWAVWFPSAGKLEPSDARTREMAVWRNRELVGMA